AMLSPRYTICLAPLSPDDAPRLLAAGHPRSMVAKGPSGGAFASAHGIHKRRDGAPQHRHEKGVSYMSNVVDQDVKGGRAVAAAVKPIVNDVTITVATSNGTGSQSAN